MTKAKKRTSPINSLKDFETTELSCRAVVHPWKVVQTFVVTYDKRKAYEVQLVCRDCRTPAVDVVSATTGEKLKGRRYGYAESGYRLVSDLKKKWGGRRVFNNNVRREYYARLSKEK